MLNRFVHPKSLNMQLCRRRSPSTRTLLLNRLLTSAGEQRQLPLWRRVLCPKVGAQASGWVWRGAIFMCLLVHRLRWSAATPSSTARVPSTTPPLPLLAIGSGLVAKMLLSHDMRYTATGITERDDRCGTRPSGELRSPTPAVHMHMHIHVCCCCCECALCCAA